MENIHQLYLLMGYVEAQSPPQIIRDAIAQLRDCVLNSSYKIAITSTGDTTLAPNKMTVKILDDRKLRKLSADDPPIKSFNEDHPEPDQLNGINPAESYSGTGRGWAAWKKEKLIEMKIAGAGPTAISKAVGKTPMQVSSMWQYLKRHRRDIPLSLKGPAKRDNPNWKKKSEERPEMLPNQETARLEPVEIYIDKETGKPVKRMPPRAAHGALHAKERM